MRNKEIKQAALANHLSISLHHICNIYSQDMHVGVLLKLFVWEIKLMERMDVGIRIREARKQKKFTQQMLADAIGVSEMYISQIERGIKMPSLNLFIQIITVLDISADYILRDTLPSGKDFVYQEVTELLDKLSNKQRRGAINILNAYIHSL